MIDTKLDECRHHGYTVFAHYSAGKYRAWSCRECKRAAVRRTRAAGRWPAHVKKARIVAAMGGACYRCGEDRMAVLTLHHRNPADRVSPRQLWIVPLTSATWAEVWLCDLLCYNCHRLEHATTLQGNVCWDYLTSDRDPLVSNSCIQQEVPLTTRPKNSVTSDPSTS